MKSKILIIEDNLDLRENIEEILDLAGYNTETASNGIEGVKKAKECSPDLILCDIMMPELDGYGVLHVLSHTEQFINTPFVFLSAKTDQIDVRKGMGLGADDYLTKPFDETDLLQTINKRLKKANTPQQFGSKKIVFDDLFANKRVKNYKNKDIVYSEGDSPYYICYLVTGKIKILEMNDFGKEMVVELCGAGDFFGYWSAIGGKDHTETAECIDNSEVWLIPIVDFTTLINQSPEIANNFIKKMSNNLLIKQHKITKLAYSSVRKRVAEALVELKEKYATEEPFSIKVNRETIASMAGTSVETAIRMLSEFKGDNLISIAGGRIEILEAEKLKNAKY